MSTQEQGDVACRSCDSDSSGTAGRSREVVEKLGVAFHKGTKVTFYHPTPHTGALVRISGVLEAVTQGLHWTSLKVDDVYYSLPAGTLVTVETGELR
jgi:hypothetical protein